MNITPETEAAMRRDIAASREEFRKRNSIPMSPVMEAQVKGFTCVNCGKEKINFTPIRRNDNGPFFCCFLCAWDFEGKNGDPVSAERAAKIRSIFEGVSNG